MTSKRPSQFKSLAGMAVASPIFFLALLAIYELTAPPSRSMIVAAGQKLGHAQEAEANAMREAEALMQFRMTQADEENKRITAAYSRLYDAMGATAQRAADLEAEVVRMQARNIDESQWARKFGTNLADVGCMLSMVSPESGLDGACEAGDMMRSDMIGEYQSIQEARTRFVDDFVSAFPRPEELLSPEFERARGEFEHSGTNE